MPAFFVTFGQRYRMEPHPVAGHPDGWFQINAPDEETARLAMHKLAGPKWALCYDEEPDIGMFPLGCLRVIDALEVLSC